MTTLDERFAALADPTDDSSWGEVVALARAGRRRTAVVLVAAVAGVLAVAGGAVAVGQALVAQQERFHATAPDDPRRVGPLAEIVSGTGWALVAWRSDVGLCLDFAIPGNSSFGCGFPVRGAKDPADASGAGPPRHAVAGMVAGALVGGDGKSTVFGVAAAEVARVEVELSTGSVVSTSVHDAPPELDTVVRFFIVRLRLPPTSLGGVSPVHALRAYDARGGLIERYEL